MKKDILLTIYDMDGNELSIDIVGSVPSAGDSIITGGVNNMRRWIVSGIGWYFDKNNPYINAVIHVREV